MKLVRRDQKVLCLKAFVPELRKLEALTEVLQLPPQAGAQRMARPVRCGIKEHLGGPVLAARAPSCRASLAGPMAETADAVADQIHSQSCSKSDPWELPTETQ